ncbi:MAG: V-type ATP synthase subunit F [Nitrososphaerota archaeon]
MGKIAAITDEDTALVFKWIGIRNSFIAKDIDEAKNILMDLSNKKEYSLILITASIAEKIESIINTIIAEREYPLIVIIPEIGQPTYKKIDPLRELLKRTIGIEIKTSK